LLNPASSSKWSALNRQSITLGGGGGQVNILACQQFHLYPGKLFLPDTLNRFARRNVNNITVSDLEMARRARPEVPR
jgi:hypothetical protein